MAPRILYTPPSWFERLDWRAVFPKVQPIEIDLGCGDGTLLLNWAKRYPDRNWLGVERLKGRVEKLERKAPRMGITDNLRGLRMESCYAVEWLFPESSVSGYHIYFPDPWPKKRHHRRRLFNPLFIEAVRRTLIPGGALNVATDHAEYFDQMLEVMSAQTGFDRAQPFVPVSEDDMTDFERGFVKAGKPICRARWTRRS